MNKLNKIVLLLLFLISSLSAIKNDFNGDGKADILWKKGKYYSLWYMNENGSHKYKYIGKKSPPYTVVGTGDFNGDGKTDILWKKDSKYSLWYMNANGSHKYKYIGKKSSSYKVVAIGDFNGDGKADILWQKGKYYSLWYMSSDGKHKYKYIGQKLSTYKVVSVADFNGDGKTDILWKKGNYYSLWYMNANGKHKYKYIGKKPSTYEVVSVADFNGDGKADILWKKGKYYSLWYMNANGSHKYKYIGQKSSPYKVAGVGDFNGNGKVDILWKKDTKYSLWYMNASGSHKYKYIGKKPLDYGVFNNLTISTNSGDRSEYYETYAERKIIIPITVPFKLHNYIKIIKDFKNRAGVYPVNEKQITYYPKAGFIGLDTIIIELHDKNDYKDSIKITYNIDVKEQPLEGFRDFIVTFKCDRKSRYYGYSSSLDLDIVNNNLERIIKVYDNYQLGYSDIPRVSKIQIEYFNARDKLSKEAKHHILFKENLENNLFLTCNYKTGYSNLIFPLSNKNWKATRGMYNGNYNFLRNDLYFYVSSLSDLHSKIYQKEYEESNNLNNAFHNANTFMDKVFPDAHYTAELNKNYNTHPSYWDNPMEKIFEKDNERYYTMLKYLADEFTEGSVGNLLEKIANNYESFYLSENPYCLEKNICGALFPEYTISLTKNASFKDGLTHWTQNKQVDTTSSNGKIDYLPTKEQVTIEFNAKTPANSSLPIATIDLFQEQDIIGNKLDDYFLYFDLDNAYGGSDGFAGYAGVKSSGLAGAYACYKDINNETLGCLAWSDYTNKAKFIYTMTNEGLSFDFYRLHSNDTFYNTELKQTFRRSAPPKERMLYSTNLGEFTAKYLPKVYEKKSEIYSIEYGMFVSEFRSNSDNSCYYCDGKVIANKIDLLKVK